MQTRMWDLISPILPNIRGTAAGRRLLAKFQKRNNPDGTNMSGENTGTTTPNEAVHPVAQGPISPQAMFGGNSGVGAQGGALSGSAPNYRPNNHRHGGHGGHRSQHSNHSIGGGFNSYSNGSRPNGNWI
jgi:hypothetical protein